MREKGDSLIESIARFDIRENQDIGLAVDGRYNAFDVAARLFAGSLYIQRAVDDDVSELACLGKFHNIDIIQRMRELGAHLFRTMDKCDTRLSIPKWWQVWMAYQIISMRCCKVGRGMTAASEKNSSLS